MKKLSNVSFYILFMGGVFLFAKPSFAASTTDFILQLPNSEITIPQSTLAQWQGSFTLTDSPLFLGGDKSTRTNISPANVYAWIAAQTTTVSAEPVAGDLTVENNKATNFTPPVIGQRLDAATTTKIILQALMRGENKAEAVVQVMPPDRTLASTNDLGIIELIGHGESIFKGSPKNRRHNIATGVEKLTGVIVAPGEEFSFNKNICPVDKSTGYLPELVIKSNDTVPEYGGGLCQVSSTVYRAAMDAGLKIIQRKNHSYAVQYYALPWGHGADATTYCGGVDFRFQNDTPGSILIWPHFEETDKLVFDFYGTKDGREVTLEKPTQYDKKSNGAMKATWIRHITKDGVTTTDTYNSNYLPPALFHKEEKLDSPGQTPPTISQLPDGTPALNISTPPPPPSL